MADNLATQRNLSHDSALLGAECWATSDRIWAGKRRMRFSIPDMGASGDGTAAHRPVTTGSFRALLIILPEAASGRFAAVIPALSLTGVGRQLPDATVLDGEQLRICSLFALFQVSSLISATFSITECFSPACMSP